MAPNLSPQASSIHRETGPVGMSLIDAVVRVLETQEKRIAQLEAERRSGVIDGGTA